MVSKPMEPKLITIHCSATYNGEKYEASQINLDHKARGWKKIGYNYIIQPDGEIQKGREDDEIGAHVEKANIYDSGINLGICLIGTDKFTLTQFIVLRNLVISLFRQYGFMNLKAHYQFESAKSQGKTCPNIDIKDLVTWVTSEIPQCLQRYILKG